MDQLLKTVTVVRRKSDGINASLCERRERIEELNGTRSLLRKVQFIFDLPHRLRKCMSAENYVGTVKYYQGALPILKAYGQSSFRKCKEESDAIISTLVKRLQAQVMNPSVLLPARAQAVSLLQQLKHPRTHHILKARKTAHVHKLSITVLDGHNDGHISVTSWGGQNQIEVRSN